MPLITSQERNVTIFLLSTALIGSVIGLFRHNWLKKPEILLSPENLLSHISKIEETNVISEVSKLNGNISSKLSVELQPSNVVNKTKSEKKRLHKIHLN